MLIFSSFLLRFADQPQCCLLESDSIEKILNKLTSQAESTKACCLVENKTCQQVLNQLIEPAENLKNELMNATSETDAVSSKRNAELLEEKLGKLAKTSNAVPNQEIAEIGERKSFTPNDNAEVTTDPMNAETSKTKLASTPADLGEQNNSEASKTKLGDDENKASTPADLEEQNNSEASKTKLDDVVKEASTPADLGEQNNSEASKTKLGDDENKATTPADLGEQNNSEASKTKFDDVVKEASTPADLGEQNNSEASKTKLGDDVNKASTPADLGEQNISETYSTNADDKDDLQPNQEALANSATKLDQSPDETEILASEDDKAETLETQTNGATEEADRKIVDDLDKGKKDASEEDVKEGKEADTGEAAQDITEDKSAEVQKGLTKRPRLPLVFKQHIPPGTVDLLLRSFAL